MPDDRASIVIDPKAKRFKGTWVGSMITHLWVYDGTLDAARKVLTLTAEGPSFTGDGTTSKYRDVAEIKSRDHRTLTSSVQYLAHLHAGQRSPHGVRPGS